MSNPDNLFAIIPIPSMGSAPRDAVAIGPMDTVFQCLPDTIARSDSIREYQAAKIDAMKITEMQKATRGIQAAAFADSVNTLTARLDALEQKRSEKLRQIAAQQRADEEKAIQKYLDQLPDPDNPEQNFNTGDLHSLPPTNTGSDNEGDLPENLLRTTPPTPGNYPEPDPLELDDPPQSKYRAPVAFSLNEGDDY